MSQEAVLPDAGSRDLAAAAAALRSRLPEPLAALAAIAYNYRWSWTPGGPELFASVDEERWELCAANPVRLLQEAHPERLAELAADQDFLGRIAALDEAVNAESAGAITAAGVTPEHPVAFFCAEYAIHGSLPVYSGGLGVLAGDILKESSDRRLPLVAIGLMYRHGYFRQRIDGSGWQHEYWVDTDPDRVPAALVTGDDGEPLTVTVPVGEREIVVQIWRVDVGRVPLLLLDANRPENSVADRWITSRLYVGDTDVRLWQYALLGVGGVRALERARHRPGGRAPQRGPRRAGRARARARRPRRLRRLGRGGARRRARAHRLHDPHARPGRQRQLSGRPDGRDPAQPLG